MCSCRTWGLLAYGRWVVLSWAVYPWFSSKDGVFQLSPFGAYIYVLFEFTCGMTFLCHLRAMCSNPGQTPRLTSPVPTDDTRFCRVCSQWKPPRSHHCSVCGICVHRMDHHCFWVNNCIGLENQKHFVLFLFYLLCTTVLALLSFFACAVEYLRLPKPKGPTNHLSVLVCTFTGILIILFLIYALEMLRDQMICIEANQTIVDQYQGKFGEPVTPI